MLNIRVLTEKSHIAEFYELATRFFLKRLYGDNYLKKLDGVIINIGFYSDTTLGGLHGQSSGYQEKQYANEYMVQLNRSKSSRNKIRTLGHELVHVAQYVDKRLITTEKMYFWGDNFWHYADVNSLTGPEMKKQIPWETEAWNLEPILYNEWKISPEYKKWKATRKRNAAKRQRLKEKAQAKRNSR